VLDRLSLAKAMIESLQEDLRPRPQLPADFVDRMIGLGKTDSPPPTDAEVEAMKAEGLVEKYLK